MRSRDEEDRSSFLRGVLEVACQVRTINWRFSIKMLGQLISRKESLIE